jgi:hypothetical protein
MCNKTVIVYRDINWIMSNFHIKLYQTTYNLGIKILLQIKHGEFALKDFFFLKYQITDFLVSMEVLAGRSG